MKNSKLFLNTFISLNNNIFSIISFFLYEGKALNVNY